MFLIRPCINYLRSALDTVLAIHEQEGPGDVLVFLPGGEEIDSAIGASRATMLPPRPP